MSVVRSVDVPADPAEAFVIFTDEIGEWYEPGPHSWNDPARAVGIRFEGARLLELYADGEPYEMGRVTVWEPGNRLVFAYRSVHLPPELETEVEVRFAAAPGGTRVTLEHRGLDRLPDDAYELWRRRAWIPFLGWFRDYVSARSTS